MMTPELWERLKPLFNKAVEKSLQDRASFIESACGDDRELRLELQLLVNAHAQPSRPAENPIMNARQFLADATRFSTDELILERFKIVRLLGSGGMGEVYQARDTRLDRTVAIKICKGRFSERFEREARAISSLNHPHICALYDFGRENSAEFLVMEYLEGETLEARLRKGALPIEEALSIATQIASALDAAHRKGVVHRDLKPGNVMLTSGAAKLLDFGLAKIAQPLTFSGTDTPGPTATQPHTVQGTILGTFQYMSPEQLEGKETDPRSDIFSFGALLYEIITGRKGFEGSSHASLIVAVMSFNPPPVSTIQPMASPALDRVVRRCLAKSPDDRWQTAGDLLSELQWISETGSNAGVAAPVSAKRRNRQRMAWLAAGLAAVLLLASLVWIATHLRNEPAPAAMVRFQIPAPDKLNFYYYEMPAVSPDGERIAFTAAASLRENDRLFVRPLNAETATEILVPDLNPHLPFWSPDARQIGFSSGGILLRVDVSGGPPVTICSSCTAGVGGGTWNRDGVILSTNRNGALYRVSAAGGEPKPLRPLAEGETAQMWPRFLPDGKHYLYLSLSNRPDQQGIYAASLDSSERKFIVATNVNAAYVQSGQLLFMRGNVLMAQPFDLRKLTLGGEPRPVADHIELAENLNAALPSATFSASPNGVLVWRRRSQSTQSSLQWFDRSGKKLGVVGETGEYSNPSLSPDDTKLAVGIRDPQTKTRDIWIFDLLRGTRTRLTFDPADDLDSIWSPDGTRIAFTSNRLGQRDIYQKPIDGSGAEELLLGGKGGQKNVEDWSGDGKYLMYNYQLPSGIHLYMLPLADDRKPVPFLNTEFLTHEGQFSPNGRWVAYCSNESGRTEIYVQGFTLDSSQARGKWQVSVAGGELPRWRRDGKELFFHFGDDYFAVDVKTDGPSFEAGLPRPLFEVSTVSSSPLSGAPFVVTRDGQRFLVLAQVEKTASAPLEVLVNWR
jgi:Tol biopolymer transport system component/predicted Ser/Thr protein kinase